MAPTEKQTIAELSARVEFLEDKIMDALESVKESQERMCADISKIKEAVYNPDTGLYARLRTLEEDVKSKNKFLWILLSMGVGSIGAAIISHLNLIINNLFPLTRRGLCGIIGNIERWEIQCTLRSYYGRRYEANAYSRKTLHLAHVRLEKIKKEELSPGTLEFINSLLDFFEKRGGLTQNQLNSFEKIESRFSPQEKAKI